MKRFALIALLVGFTLLAGGDAFATQVTPALNVNLGTGEGLTVFLLNSA
jgi:hypothetical protein